MDLISDILLIAGALGAAFYCFILSRRLKKFTNLENGVGGAVAVLSAQVDDMTKMLNQAQGSATESTKSLEALTQRAEDVSRRLELMVASMHDIPAAPAAPAQPATFAHAAPAPAAPPPQPVAQQPAPAAVPPAPAPEPVPETPSLFRSARGQAQEVAA